MQNKRTCIITRGKLEKPELFQIKFNSRLNDWNWKFIFWWSENKNISWRSIYIKNDKNIFDQFLKRPKNFLENFLKRKISSEKFLELKKFLEKI